MRNNFRIEFSAMQRRHGTPNMRCANLIATGSTCDASCSSPRGRTFHTARSPAVPWSLRRSGSGLACKVVRDFLLPHFDGFACVHLEFETVDHLGRDVGQALHAEAADDWVYSVDVARGLAAVLDLPDPSCAPKPPNAVRHSYAITWMAAAPAGVVDGVDHLRSRESLLTENRALNERLLKLDARLLRLDALEALRAD